MTAAAMTTLALHAGIHFSGSSAIVFAKSILTTVAVTTVVWVVVTFLTKPEPDSKLLEFYRRVRPATAGWKRIAARAPDIPATQDGWYNLADWLLGCLMVYMALFGIGKLCLGSTGPGLTFLAISAGSGYAIYWDFSRRGWETLSGRDQTGGWRKS